MIDRITKYRYYLQTTLCAALTGCRQWQHVCSCRLSGIYSGSHSVDCRCRGNWRRLLPYHVLLCCHRPLLSCLHLGNVTGNELSDSLCVDTSLARHYLHQHRHNSQFHLLTTDSRRFDTQFSQFSLISSIVLRGKAVKGQYEKILTAIDGRDAAVSSRQFNGFAMPVA